MVEDGGVDSVQCVWGGHLAAVTEESVLYSISLAQSISVPYN